jgi:hypothetical protein
MPAPRRPADVSRETEAAMKRPAKSKGGNWVENDSARNLSNETKIPKENRASH